MLAAATIGMNETLELAKSVGALVAVLSAVVLPMVVFIAIGRWILGPIDRAARARNCRPKLFLADLLCLFVAVQLPLGAVYQFRGEETEVFFAVLTVLAWVVAPIIWLSCARALSRAGVERGWQRMAFLGIVLPVVYYGLLPFIVLGWLGISRFVVVRNASLIDNWAWVAGWLLLGCGLVASGLYNSWMLRSVEAKGEEDAGEE